MLDMGVIEKSLSKWYSLVVLFPKLDDTIWFCINFCKLDAAWKFDAHPTSQVNKLSDWLGKTKYVSTLDLKRDTSKFLLENHRIVEN